MKTETDDVRLALRIIPVIELHSPASSRSLEEATMTASMRFNDAEGQHKRGKKPTYPSCQ